MTFGVVTPGTVGDIITHLRDTRRPRLPEALEQAEAESAQLDPNSEEERPRVISELINLHDVPYREIVALRAYHQGFSPFETNHGVKGAQFENVLVVVGRGWSKYNFSEMLEWSSAPALVLPKSKNKFEQNRNLFYVACSRPKVRLAVLFTQILSPTALSTATRWFGSEAVKDLPQPVAS